MSPSRRRGCLVSLLLIVGACRSEPARQPQSEGSAVEAPATAAPLSEFQCGAEHPEGSRCGELEVAEDRDDPKGRSIPLRWVVVPARGDAPAPDPLFVFAGGPGQAATDLTAMALGPLAAINETRELVFVDQRGTGASNGLRCPPQSFQGLIEGVLAPDQVAVLAACRASYEADLAHYATTTAMADIDELRAALGYAQINLYGVSYGTRAALEYMRRYPAATRSVSLWGVAGPGPSFLTPFVAATEHALERLFADCSADTACAAVLPGGRASFEATLARLEQAPARIEVADPRDGQIHELLFTRDVFVTAVRLMLYDAGWSAELPAKLMAAEQGSYTPLANFLASFAAQIAAHIAYGMHLSVACSEDLPFMSEADLRASAESVLGPEALGEYVRSCADWPRAELPADWGEALRSEVPVLLMVGELDPATPPASAHAAAAELSNARVVVVPNTAHGTSNAEPCVSEVFTDFVEDPRPDQLELGCVAEVARPAFALP